MEISGELRRPLHILRLHARRTLDTPLFIGASSIIPRFAWLTYFPSSPMLHSAVVVFLPRSLFPLVYLATYPPPVLSTNPRRRSLRCKRARRRTTLPLAYYQPSSRLELISLLAC